MTMYEKFCQLEIEGRWIGLEKGDLCADFSRVGCKNVYVGVNGVQ